MTAFVVLLLGLGAMTVGILLGRYYVPDDRNLKRSARHARSYVKTINLLLNRNYDDSVKELIAVVKENVDDVEPYFALGALFRQRGEWERAIRVHQSIEMREPNNRQLCQRARYQLGLDFRSAKMPRRAIQAMEDCLQMDPKQMGALLALASLYEEQGRYVDSAGMWNRITGLRGDTDTSREHHLLCAAAQSAIEIGDLLAARPLLSAAGALEEHSPHVWVATAELAAAEENWPETVANLQKAIETRPDLSLYLAGPLQAAELEVAESVESPGPPGAENAVTRDIAVRPQATPLELWPAQIVAARSALDSGDAAQIQQELRAIVGADGLLETGLGAPWACGECQSVQAHFFWRCEACRRWGTAEVTAIRRTTEFQRQRDRRSQPRPLGLPDAGDAESSTGPSSEKSGSWLGSALDKVRRK